MTARKIHSIVPYMRQTLVRKRLLPCPSSSNHSFSTAPGRDIDISNQPNLALDFFGEPVTFAASVSNQKVVMEALDAWILAVITKGRSCIGGGAEQGLEAAGNHSVAMTWSRLLVQARHASMVQCATVAPLLVQAGTGYMHHVDELLQSVPLRRLGMDGKGCLSLHKMAQQAVTQVDDARLEARERYHLQALEYLLQDDHETALQVYLALLRECPGDLLGVSLALDATHTTGDKESALRAVGSITAYWAERSGGWITPALAGQDMATALMAVGWAAGGRVAEAEQTIDRSQRMSVAGALHTWAKAHVYDATGRIAEGISACANHDGTVTYEGAGWLFFEDRLGGYGARFSLDREERGRGKSAALRLYERHFDRIFDYSGFSKGQLRKKPEQRAPLSWSKPATLSLEESKDTISIWDRIRGKAKDDSKKLTQKQRDYYDIVLKEGRMPSTRLESWEPVLEDVLTWLPPTPQLLADATLLLLRFTLNGTISAQNLRWDHMRSSWQTMLELQKLHNSNLLFCPMAALSASLLCEPSDSGGDCIGNGRMATGLNSMGKLMRLGNATTEAEKTTTIREVIADRDPKFWLPAPSGEETKWQEVVDHFTAALSGYTDDSIVSRRSLRFEHWDFETRPLFEHAIVYACCKAGDMKSLSLARSISCNGVTLRPNSPEEWWRYSIVLGLLGDEVGSEDALTNSINFGGGQGTKY